MIEIGVDIDTDIHGEHWVGCDCDECLEARSGFVLSKSPLVLEVVETGWSYWEYFKPHHYLLNAGPMPFSTAYVGFVGETPVAHLGVTGMHVGKGTREARACRMVVMPEWQGAGVGMRFLNSMCERELEGVGFIERPTTTLFHTNHPALAGALRRDMRWRQISYRLYGDDGAASNRTLKAAAERQGKRIGQTVHYGGHFRGVQGYRYYGQRGLDAWEEFRERDPEKWEKLAVEYGLKKPELVPT